MNRRCAERINMEVPVTIGEIDAMTRDISSNGIYFMAPRGVSLDGKINFSVQLQHVLPGKPLRLVCQGEIVRTEDLGEQTGIAATIDRYCYRH